MGNVASNPIQQRLGLHILKIAEPDVRIMPSTGWRKERFQPKIVRGGGTALPTPAAAAPAAAAPAATKRFCLEIN